MAYVQIRPQQSPTIAAGQFLAVAEILPRENWRDFPESLQTAAAGFPAAITSSLGATLKEFLFTNQTIIRYFASRGETAIRQLPIGQVPVRDQAGFLRSIFETLLPYLTEFRLELKHLEDVFGRAMSSELERYASVFSRSIREHRNILEQPPYRVGLEGLRLSSIDRFPVIDGEAPGIWYVPNIRTLARAGSDVLHFTLNEVCREHYERIRGASLELYLHKMVTSRAPKITVISEGKWLTPRGEAAGPDLLVIDHRDPPCILAIEVKFRKMLPGTRFDLSPEDLGHNYADLWKALLLLPAKLEYVFNMHGDYAAYASDLRGARNYRRWYVGLAGEAPYAFGELSHYLGETSPNFPLYQFTEPWTVMSVETFERLVEVMVQHGRALANVVEDYCGDCQNLELSLPRADMFRNADIDDQESYAARCLQE